MLTTQDQDPSSDLHRSHGTQSIHPHPLPLFLHPGHPREHTALHHHLRPRRRIPSVSTFDDSINRLVLSANAHNKARKDLEQVLDIAPQLHGISANCTEMLSTLTYNLAKLVDSTASQKLHARDHHKLVISYSISQSMVESAVYSCGIYASGIWYDVKGSWAGRREQKSVVQVEMVNKICGGVGMLIDETGAGEARQSPEIMA